MLTPPGAAARITSAGRVVDLAVGQHLTVGRGSDQDLRIAHDPEDLRIPRRAIRLDCWADGVLVQNTSDKRTLVARGFPGAPFEILPMTLVGSAPHDVLEVGLTGASGRPYTITIDTRALLHAGRASRTPVPRGDADRGTIGYARIPTLTTRERQLLVALCWPSWSGRVGRDEVPTYRELEELFRARGVQVGHGRIRKTLDELRERLAVDHQVSGVSGSDPADSSSTAGGKQTYLPVLARWARASSNVTDEELEAFDEDAARPA